MVIESLASARSSFVRLTNVRGVIGPIRPEGLDPRIVKALSHPLRHRLLVRLNEGEASPVQMARELGEPVGNVSFHVRTLAAVGAIELVRTVPRRGALEHVYRAVIPAWFSDEDWARVPASARQAIGAWNLEEILRDLGRASFAHPNAYLSRRWQALDEQAMREISDVLTATLQRVEEIASASDERRKDGDPALSTEIVLLHFER
jgi:DNA-binding transcriptional ArsR family regulator